MVCNLPELSLDLSPPSVKLSYSDYLTDLALTRVGINNNNSDSGDLVKFIDGLEEEIKKIQAFQRELPLSFNLLNDAIGKFKEKVKKCEVKSRWQNGNNEESVGVKLGVDVVEKKDWMSSVQLWAPSNEEKERGLKAEGGTVSSFKEDEKAPILSLVTVAPVVVEPICRVFPTCSVDQTERSISRPGCHSSSRKQRRCWSPELHRRFVDALEKLGGPRVATPKQIRELMHVDGLTNDEVKSHLQKYRLHIRKLSPSSTNNPPSIDQEMGGETLELGYSNSDIQHSGSPEGPLFYSISKKCNSSSMDEDDEENSDGQSWKAAQQHISRGTIQLSV